MNNFLSCDWGTSAFRLRLIKANSLAIIAEERTSQGIAETFQLWKQSEKNEESRIPFYLDIISTSIRAIEQKTRCSLDNFPLIISGMASSTIGMIELPYKNLPFATTGEDLETLVIDEAGSVKQKVVIISGVRTETDVMRGEETKLVGSTATNDIQDHIYIFPGTHPKHVRVKNNQAIEFKTYMTGEFFELLSQKSILSVSAKKGGVFETQSNIQSFAKGVNDSLSLNLLHSSFLVRTNQLFNLFSLEQNYFYLSGLLIGTELKDLLDTACGITLVSNTALFAQYTTALRILELPKKETTVTTIDADEALIKGQWEVYKRTNPSKHKVL